MPQYKLNYFEVRGRAEVCRLIFAQAGQEFIDHRFNGEKWRAEEKPDSRRYPFGQAPTLEIDDVVLPESIPIARFLASEFGLSGKNNLEKAWCDIVSDFCMDVKKDAWSFTKPGRKEKDDAKFEEQKKEAFEGSIAKKLECLEATLKKNNGGNGFFVGDGVTWADLSFQDIAFLVLELYPTCLDKAPLLKALYERVNALPLVKKYLDARPTTSI